MNLKLIFLYKYFWLFWFKLLLKFKIKGLENFKDYESEGVLFIANHSGHVDAVLTGIAIPWSYFKRTKTIRFMTYYKYIEEVFYGPVTKFCGGYSIRPNGGNLDESMAETIDILKNKKHNVLMFPEGKKMDKLDLDKIRPGLGYLAKKIDPQIVPVYIEGTLGLGFLEALFKQRKVEIKFGKAFRYRDIAKEDDDFITISKKAMAEVVKLREKND